MHLLKMTDLNLKNKKVLIREDFNVPIDEGNITSDARIHAALPTIEYVRKSGGKLILMSHLGRPEAGKYDPDYSLLPVAECLSKLLKHPVRLQCDWINGIHLDTDDIVLCENVRFCVGETENDETLARQMAALADIFVMDAFGAAHRAHASTYGVAQFVKTACAGPLLLAELSALKKALEKPVSPVVSIIGGSKASTKVGVIESILQISDHLIVGGGIANTFLAAQGHDVGCSLHEPNFIEQAGTLLKAYGKKIPLPTDVVLAKTITKDAKTRIASVTDIQPDEMILDIGPDTAKRFAKILKSAQTIIWNGPVGVFEYEPFAAGTAALAKAIAASAAFSIAGGGDTLAAIEKYGIANQISYISTGGGAFLEFLQYKTLPAVDILEQRTALNTI